MGTRLVCIQKILGIRLPPPPIKKTSSIIVTSMLYMVWKKENVNIVYSSLILVVKFFLIMCDGVTKIQIETILTTSKLGLNFGEIKN